jgi:hypothetical protein
VLPLPLGYDFQGRAVIKSAPPTGIDHDNFNRKAAIDLAVAGGLSSLIGFERQWRNRLAGLRTNTLVALGSASFVIFEALVPGDASPTRVAAQVVSGIGFLGAGLIFREGLSVRGLNTAATIWCLAAVGVLAGAGYPAYAALSTGFILFVNLLLRPIVMFINRQPLIGTEVEVGLSGLGHLPQSGRGACARATVARPCGRRARASPPRQQRCRRDRAGRRDRDDDGVPSGRRRCREDRRPAQPRADGLSRSLAGRDSLRRGGPAIAGTNGEAPSTGHAGNGT